MMCGILSGLQQAINYLNELQDKIQPQRVHKVTLTKREQVVNLIKKMARQMSFPKETIDQLNNLDLALATDEEVDLILNHVTNLIADVERENKRLGINIFQQVKILNN
jgi:hypothetical protein